MSKFRALFPIFACLVLVVSAACAPTASAPPTTDTAMMVKETDSAMMAKETDTAMMMAKETDTAMMMAKETDTAMMMAKETDTAMMAKETDTAMMAKATDTAMMMAKATDTAMMAKETDTAMMAKETDTAMMAQTPDAMPKTPDAMMVEFPQQQFAAHFVDSMPMHAQTLDKLPVQVLLNFNFTLSDASTITIEKDGKEVKSMAGTLGDKKLSMTGEIPADAGSGLYLVKYKACWPDNSCHNRQFAFLVSNK